MDDYNNVECLRCGREWYSDKFEKEGDLPDKCPRCYQEEVREIPEPPTRIDVAANRIREKKKELPEQAKQKKHDFVVWRENNRFLIALVKAATVFLLLILGIVYLLFFN
jgi:NAD-dependent SIR2 family protein deacetylase